MAGIAQVILAGGSGTRLWPASRLLEPKQFMTIDGRDSLLQATLRRSEALELDGLLTTTNRQLFFQTRDQYKQLPSYNPSKMAYQLEPYARNTLAPITLAAMYYQSSLGPDQILLVTPADHVIDKLAAYRQDVDKAIACAQAGALVVFGIPPTHPATGYGYIKCGPSRAHSGAYEVEAFVEKPSLTLAQTYLEAGDYLWNSGLLCFKVSSYLALLAELDPEAFAACEHCWQVSQGDSPYELVEDAFSAIPDISVDYAVIEKAPNRLVIPAQFVWSDVGSWTSIADLGQQEADAAGNIMTGPGKMLDSENCYVRSEQRFVAGIGLKNLVVVDTADALLIMDKDSSENIKHLVMGLGDSPLTRSNARVTHRPWGTYEIILEGPNFKIKRIHVQPAASLSLQLHHQRAEHWIIVSGVARVVNGNEEFTLYPDEYTHIPIGTQHRLTNPGSLPLVMIEVQIGAYTGEDDIVRLTDIYGRVKRQSCIEVTALPK